MKKIAFVTDNKIIYPIAEKIKEQGSEVYIYPVNEVNNDSNFNIINSVRELYLVKPSVVVFDSNRLKDIANKLNMLKCKIINIASIFDEIDKQKVVKMCKLKEILKIKVKGIEEVEKIISETKLLYDIRSLEDENIFVSPKNEEELNQFIEYAKKSNIKYHTFEVNEKIFGIRITSTMWFSKGNLIKPVFYNIKTEKQDLDFQYAKYDYANSISYYSAIKEPIIVQKFFKKMTGLAKKILYSGMLSIKCIVCCRDIFLVDFSTCFEYGNIYSFFSMIDYKIADFFYNIYNGLIEEIVFKNKYCYNVAVLKSIKDNNEIKFNEDYKENIWVVKEKNHIAEIVATNNTVYEASKRINEICNEIKHFGKLTFSGYDDIKNIFKKYITIRNVSKWF